MGLAAGALTKGAVTSTTAALSSAVATGGTTPYTYQWYRSVVTGFTPGGGNIISGATALTLNDSGLTPGTQYYYVVKATDSAGTPATANSSQLSVATSQPVLDPNQFAETSFLGVIDQRFDYDTIPVQIDASQSGTLYPGQAVKIYDSADGVPKVVACTAVTDNVFGFINFDVKSQSYVANDMCEISQSGNVLYLYSTGAIARGAQVCLDIVTVGGVGPLVSLSNVVGWAMDKASAAGTLIRVRLTCPSFSFAS